MNDFVFDAIYYSRQANAQYRCRNIIGDDVMGYCIDAIGEIPAGSTKRYGAEDIDDFCSTSTVWRDL